MQGAYSFEEYLSISEGFYQLSVAFGCLPMYSSRVLARLTVYLTDGSTSSRLIAVKLRNYSIDN